MSPSTRAWLLLVVTLLLGIVLGVLGGGALQERRRATLEDIRRPGGFAEHLRDVIRPTSDSQWNAIRPLIEANARRNQEMRRAQDDAMRATLDSLKAALMPMLDAAQRERLARFVPRRPGGGPPGSRGGRPDGPRGPREGPDGGPPGGPEPPPGGSPPPGE